MGSPMVFHTAPPHPASKARMICSPQLVGGAEASQKGLIQGMPQKVVARVGLVMFGPPRCADPDGRALPIRNRVDHLAASVGAVTAGKEFRIRGLPAGAIDHN